MNIYQSLLQRWQDTLSDADRAHVQRVSDRHDARKAYTHGPRSDSEEDSSGFVEIARVFSADPVMLFGQDTPAMAYSRMTITKAVRTPEGGFVPGDVVFQARLSDRALTLLIMESNQGRTQSTLTGERLGAFALPAYTPPATKPADAAFDDERTSASEPLRTAYQNLRTTLEQGASAKIRKQAAADLARLVGRMEEKGGVDYMLEQRVDSLAKRRVEMVSEVAHAALHAEKLVHAMQQPRLAAPVVEPVDFNQARNAHPMLDASMEPMNPQERAVVLRLLELERDDALRSGGSANAFGGETLKTWPQGQALSPFGPEAKKRIDALSTVAREAIHRDKSIDPRCFSMGIVWTQGWPGFLHASLPSTSGRYATLHIESAWMESSHADARVQSAHHPVLEIMLAPDDLMMALRGHPTGAMTPCTFRTLASSYVPAEKRSRTSVIGEAGKRAEARIAAADETKALENAIQAVADRLEAPGAGKAWKADTDAALDALAMAIEGYARIVDREGFEEGLADVADVMRTMVRHDLDEIRAVLPEPVLRKLLT